MTKKRQYKVAYTDLRSEELSQTPFGWTILARSNADARTTFKRQMRTEFDMIEGKQYRINSVKLVDTLKAVPKAESTSKMGLKEAEGILGNRAKWEVTNMKKALSSMELMNTPEENRRLEACKVWLKSNK